MGDKLLDLQRLAFGRIADEGQCLLRALGDAHIAAHAGGGIDAGKPIINRNRAELARARASAAAGA